MPPSALTVSQGQIERITYTNDGTSYTIAKVKVFGRRDLVTVIGEISSYLKPLCGFLYGPWRDDRPNPL
jgi:hypothetical protein